MEPLKGQITFTDVMAQPGFAQETPEVKNQVADAFFSKHVASQPGFADEDPETQQNIRLEFNKKYQIGGVAPTDSILGNVAKGLNTANLAAGSFFDPAIGAYTFGITDPKTQAEADARKRYPGIETDPGLLGDAYRLHQNGLINSLGGMAGAFTGTAGLVKAAENTIAKPLTQLGTGLAKPFLGTVQQAANTAGVAGYSGLSNLAQVLQGKQNPLEALGSTAVDIAAAPVGGNSRLKNMLAQGGAGAATTAAGSLIHGQKIDPMEVIKNALMQAGVGAALHTTPKAEPKVTPEVSQYRQVNIPGVKTAVAQKGRISVDQAYNAQAHQTEVGRVNDYAKDAIKNARAAQGLSEKNTYEVRLQKLKAAHKVFHDMATNHPSKPARERAAKLRDATAKEYAKVQAEKESKFPSQKPTKTYKTLKPEQTKTVIKLGVKAYQEGGASKARFRQALKGYNANDQFKVNKGIESELKAAKDRTKTEKDRATLRRENAKTRRAEENKNILEAAQKAAEVAKTEAAAEKAKQAAETAKQKKAESDQLFANAIAEATRPAETPKGTATELQGPGPDEYARMAKEARTAPKAEKPKPEPVKKEGKGADEVLDILEAVKPKEKTGTANEYTAAGPDEYKRMAREAKAVKLPKPTAGPKGAQSKESILTQALFAKEHGLELRLEYEAEGGKSRSGGERESSTYRFKRDTVLDVVQNKNGDIILKTINENGQTTTRHLHEPESGSRIYTAKATNEPARYAMSDGRVVDKSTGEVVEQKQEQGTFSSDIRESIENYDRVMRKYKQKQARVGVMLKATKTLSDKAVMDGLDERNPQVVEDISGEPC